MRKATVQLIGVGLTEFAAPAPYGLAADCYASLNQEFYYIPVAQTEVIVEPNCVTDDFV